MIKPITLVKICYKLLYIIQGVLISDFLASKILVAIPIFNAASYWPRNVFTLRVFLYSISLTFCREIHYFVEAYKQIL